MKIKKIAALVLAGALSVSMLSGCGINKNAVVATMEGREVTLGIANFLCRYQEAMVDDIYLSYYGEDMWDEDSGTGMIGNLRDGIMDSLHEMYTLKDHMEDYGVEITEEEKKAIVEAATAFMEKNSKEAIKEMGATQELVEEALTLYTIQHKMYDAIIVDADTEVSDEDANMRAYTVVRIPIVGEYDENYQYTAYTDEQIEKVKANAAKMAEALKESSDLEAVAEEYGFEATTATYAKDDEKLDEDVKDALDKLKEGELSGQIDTEQAIYFLRLDKETDEEATENNRKSIIEERQSELYTETLEGWQEDDGWKVKEKQLSKIVFKNHFTQKTESDEQQNSESVDNTEGDAAEESESETLTEANTEN